MKKYAKFTALALVLVLAVAMLTACVPSDVESAEAKLKAAGYVVVSYSEEADGLQGGFLATKGLIGGESVYALYFDSAASAKEWFNANTSRDDTTTKCAGKWVYWGTEGGMKDFAK